MEIRDLLKIMVDKDASDLYLQNSNEKRDEPVRV